jgi:RNA-directed DNA polymerase
VKLPPARRGTPERSEKQAMAGREKSECRDTSDEAGEPTQGTLRSKERHRDMEPSEGTMSGIPSSQTISTKLERIAELAKKAPQMAFTSLSHHIDVEWLREAHRRTRKDGAPGVDGRSAEEYAQRLDENLSSLLNRAKTGMYRAPPVRRVYIPKGDGAQTRPIGIPTFEDKVLQRAVAMVLEAVYEQDFYDCSFGFRPGRSAHDALKVLDSTMMKMCGGWILEVDIKKFFDALDHNHLREILRQRVRDGVLLRLIGKWLNAGVLEGLELSRPDLGTPQGGVISPLLANIYLHTVLDEWFAKDVVPRLHGQAHLVRYADDFVMVFAQEIDARRVHEVLPKRFAKYGLTLHPEKTRLVAFRRPGPSNGGEGLGTFDLLGFTHHWSLSRNGRWLVKRRTAKDRLSRALRRAAEWCRLHRHDPVRAQQLALARKLRGHYAYYGIALNYHAIKRFFFELCVLWRKWLSRRSRHGRINWARMNELLARRFPLPKPRIVHPFVT